MSMTSHSKNDESEPSTPTHQLTHSQRARLIKSTRKLAKVLGTTPLLHLAPPSPMERGRGGSRSMDAVRLDNQTTLTRDKLSALDPINVQGWSDSAWAHRNLSESDVGRRVQRSWPPENLQVGEGSRPPVFFVKMKKRPPTELDTGAAQRYTLSNGKPLPVTPLPITPLPGSPSASPSSRRFSAGSLSSTLTSPLNMRFPQMYQVLSSVSNAVSDMDNWKKEKDLKTRRKKMDKLVRHLGEAVPPELVFNAGQVRANKWNQRKSRSLSITPTRPSGDNSQPYEFVVTPSPLGSADPHGAPQQSLPVTPETSPPPDAVPASRAVTPIPAHIGEVPSVSVRPPPSHLRQRSTTPLPRLASLFYSRARLEQDYDQWEQEEQGEEREEGSYERSSSRAGLASMFGMGDQPEPLPLIVAHRSERRQGWSGEWNAASVQDVIVKLRDLK